MTIREIAEKTGVSTYTLRYYERIGLLPPIHRRENGIRDYTEQDAERIYCIQNLKASGMPLKKNLKYIELTGTGDTARQKRKTILLEAREALQKKWMIYGTCWRRRIFNRCAATAACRQKQIGALILRPMQIWGKARTQGRLQNRQSLPQGRIC